MNHALDIRRKVASRACDSCRRRKIRCNGLQPCTGCAASHLACTFVAPRGQGGNRGARAKVLNELRANQLSGSVTLDPSLSYNTSSNEDASTVTTSVPLDQNTFEPFVSVYENRIHRIVPLLDPIILRAEASQANTSPISRQLSLAFCAYVINFGDLSDEVDFWSSQSSLVDAQNHYLNHALLFQDLARVKQPDPRSVYISFFLYGAYAGQGNYRQAWYYLREATTLFMMLGSDRLEWYSEELKRRLFWILVVSERAHAVRRNRPITLQTASPSPLLDEHHERGMRYLSSIFRLLDETFFAVWNGSKQECTKEWLLQLECDIRSSLPPILQISNEQTANVRISQLWILIKIWELFPRFGFLSTESTYECLTFRYPATIAKDLMILAIKVPIQSLQVLGVGMTEKVFDIACALTDVLPFVSYHTPELELGPSDYLVQLILLMSKLPGGSSKFVPLLLAKVNELLPELMESMCEAAQMPLHVISDPMSPNTRFAYEEEVGQGLYTHLRRS